jgi:hypothetical protein
MPPAKTMALVSSIWYLSLHSMRYIFILCLTLTLFVSCKKENTAPIGNAPRVEIYLLESFTVNINQATNPAALTITDAVLAETPLVADQDITYYSKSTTTFKLMKDIKPIILNYKSDKAFAVTVDKQPVYFGRFHPAYLSSITFGMATIDPILFHNGELRINFATIEGNANFQLLDKRNDDLITNAFRSSGRLR